MKYKILMSLSAIISILILTACTSSNQENNNTDISTNTSENNIEVVTEKIESDPSTRLIEMKDNYFVITFDEFVKKYNEDNPDNQISLRDTYARGSDYSTTPAIFSTEEYYDIRMYINYLNESKYVNCLQLIIECADEESFNQSVPLYKEAVTKFIKTTVDSGVSDDIADKLMDKKLIVYNEIAYRIKQNPQKHNALLTIIPQLGVENSEKYLNE